MEYRHLVFCVVLLFHVNYTTQDCRIVQTPLQLKTYWCNTIQELEKNGNAQLLDVNIYNGNTLPILSNATHNRIPNLQLVLNDEASEGFSPATYQILKDVLKQSQNRRLTSITKGLFENLPLQKLHLKDCGIETIQVGAFSNMQSLHELHIIYNNLKSVETGIFNSLPVETLALSNNKISVIRRNALFNMKNLKHLHLDGNHLSEFRPDLFIGYGSNLKTLLLQGNYLTDFDRNTVKTLDNLKILNVANNRIARIIIYAFENLLQLEELNLSGNQLLDLDAEILAVDGMPSLNKIHINDNRLSYLTPKFLGRLSNLKYIRLLGNPWMCPCFDAIMQWLSDHNIQQFCDNDYYSGARPVCVVSDVRSSTCDYTNTATQFANKYAEVNHLQVKNQCSS